MLTQRRCRLLTVNSGNETIIKQVLHSGCVAVGIKLKVLLQRHALWDIALVLICCNSHQFTMMQLAARVKSVSLAKNKRL